MYIESEDDKIDPDFTFMVANGFKVAATHGDKDSVGNVVKNVSLMVGESIDLVVTAHKHHLSADETNKCVVISNPSLIGVDDYSKDLRLTSRPAQTLVIMGTSAPVECIYYINLDEE